MKTAKRANVNWEGYVLIGLIIVYTATFSFVAYLKYQSFYFNDMDLAAINQAFWNASRGHFIPHQPGESVLFSGHKWVIIFPLIPLYALFPSPLTLLFLQSLGLGLGAWAIYLLARDLLSPRFGLLFAFCYLIYPAMNYVNLFEFHPLAFATPLLLFTFYFYYKRKWGLFILFILLSLSVREDVAIAVSAMGLFAMLQGARQADKSFWERFKWGLLPIFLAIFWFTVCTKFTPVKSTASMKSFYDWLGGSPGQILKTILLHPGKVLSGVLIREKMLYLFHLFVPVALLPLFSPSALLMTLLSLSEGLLSQRDTHFSIHWQYSSIVTPFIFISSIYGARNVLRWKAMARRGINVFIIVLIFSVVSAKTLGPLFNLPEGIKHWRVTEEDEVRQALTNKIPPEAPIMVTFELSPKLSMRPRLFYFFFIYAVSAKPQYRAIVTEAQKASQYALIDFNDHYSFHAPDGDLDASRFLWEGRWGVVENVNNLVLFQKDYKTPFRLIEKVTKPEISRPINLEVAPGLRLLGYDIEEVEWEGRRLLDFSCYMKTERTQSKGFAINPFLFSGDNPNIYFEQPLLAPNRIFPTNRWEVGEVYKQRCRILVPEKLPPGVYDLRLALEDRRPLLIQGRMDWGVYRNFVYEEDGIFVK